MTYKNENVGNLSKLRKTIMLILSIILLITPLIVKLKVFEVPSYVSTYYPMGKTFDFFTYYKAMLLRSGAFIALALTIFYNFKSGKAIKLDLVTGLHLLLAGAITLATFASPYKEVAIFGFFNKNGGLLTWYAYIALSYCFYLFVETQKEVDYFIKLIVGSTALVSLIGFFQLIGMDYIKYDFFKKIIDGPYYEQLKAASGLIFSDGTVYSTLANPNFVGSVIAIAFPLLVYLFSKATKITERAALSVVMLLELAIIVFSKSTAGLLSAVLTSAIYVAIMFVDSQKLKKVSLVVIVVTILAAGGLLAGVGKFSDGNRFESIDIQHKLVNEFKNIKIDGAILTITDTDENSIVIKHNNQTIWVEDKAGKVLTKDIKEFGEIYQDAIWHITYDKNVRALSIIHLKSPDNVYKFRQFFVMPDGYSVLGVSAIDKQPIVKSANLIKNESFMTWRGYIWNRTIPLITEQPLLGHGADTFVLIFPQNDILNKRVFNLINDKAHSIYLQYMMDFGVIGALSFFLILGFAFRVTDKIELRLCLLAYLITGLTNDSTVTSGLIIFAVFGLIFALQKGEDYEKKAV